MSLRNCGRPTPYRTWEDAFRNWVDFLDWYYIWGDDYWKKNEPVVSFADFAFDFSFVGGRRGPGQV